MDRLVPGIVVAFAAGIAAARGLPLPAALAFPPAVALGLYLAVRVPALQSRLPRPFDARASPALLALAALLGAARASLDGLPPGGGSLAERLPADGAAVVVEGTALEAALPLPGLPRGDGDDGRAVHRFALEVDRVRGEEGACAAEGRLEVFVDEPPPPFLPGDRLRVSGIRRTSRGGRNPGARDRPPAARLQVPGPGRVEILDAPPRPGPARAAAALREAALGTIRRSLRGPGAALYEALLVGRTADLDPEEVRDWRRTGTWHVLVVSGFQVALAAAAAHAILSRAGAGPGAVAAGTTLAAAAYAAASGFGAPALRALVAVGIVAFAPLLRRRADAVHSLFVAAGLLLAADPGALGDPGFQLSFAAVLGILRLSPALGDLFFARRRFLRRFPLPAADRSLGRRVGDLVERGLPTALAAWGATAPILLHHFGTVSPVTPLANLVLVPLATAVLAAGALLLPLGLLLPGLATAAADGAAALLALTVGAFSALPGACLLEPVPPPWLLAGDGLLLVLAAHRPTPARLAAAAAGLASLAFLPLALAPRPAAPSLLVLDVGHGQAVLADSGRARVLCDAGGRSPRTGSDAILPALRARGALALEALVLSHEDVDHLSAAREVLESLPVGRLVVGRGFGGSPAAAEVLDAAAREGVPLLRVAAGAVLRWPGLEIEVLHPSPAGDRAGDARPYGDNDSSLAIRVRMEGLAALLPGDVEGPGIGALLLSGADLRADVLLLPHHGSPGAAGTPLLAAATRARVLVASAGPSTAVVGSVASPRAPRLLVTRDAGAVLATPGGVEAAAK